MRIETVSGVRLSPSRAVETFLYDFDQVASVYEYHWDRTESFGRRAEYLTGGGYRGDREALVSVLERYNRALGAGPSTLEAIAQLTHPQALTVVTGQQAGIFTGPAYSIYKAMTAIRLAQEQSRRLGVPVIPVYWIAGEDHDWQEVSWVRVPVPEGTVSIALQESLDEGDRRSVGLTPAPASLYSDVLAEFAHLMPETEFKAQVLEQILGAAQGPPALDPAITAGKPTLADWFGRVITWLFDGTGLVVVNSSDPALRRLEASFFAQTIQSREAVDQALAAGMARWEAMGYAPTVNRIPGSLNLFTYVDGQRLHLVDRGGQICTREQTERSWTEAHLVDQALTRPELFSANVVTRPLVQAAVFPDLAYVGGPGEISYFGLLRDVYRALDLQMPIVYPRESFTLVEPPLARILEKQGLALEDAFFRLDEKRQELLEREDRLGIPQLFSRFRTEFGTQYDRLLEQVLQLDANLHHVAHENRKQIGVQINRLEEKARQQHRKNCDVALRQFDRLQRHLWPDGLQERSVSFLPYLVKYGPDLLGRIMAQVPFEDGWRHRAIFL